MPGHGGRLERAGGPRDCRLCPHPIAPAAGRLRARLALGRDVGGIRARAALPHVPPGACRRGWRMDRSSLHCRLSLSLPSLPFLPSRLPSHLLSCLLTPVRGEQPNLAILLRHHHRRSVRQAARRTDPRGSSSRGSLHHRGRGHPLRRGVADSHPRRSPDPTALHHRAAQLRPFRRRRGAAPTCGLRQRGDRGAAAADLRGRRPLPE